MRFLLDAMFVHIEDWIASLPGRERRHTDVGRVWRQPARLCAMSEELEPPLLAHSIAATHLPGRLPIFEEARVRFRPAISH